MLVQQHADYLNKTKNESIEKEVVSFMDPGEQRAMRFCLNQQAGLEEMQSWIQQLPQESMAYSSWNVIEEISGKLDGMIVAAKTNADNYRMANISPLKWELVKGLEENIQEFATMSFEDMK